MAGGSAPLPDSAKRISTNPANTTPKSKDPSQSLNTPSPAPTNGVTRTRSVRTGATGSPVSARAAAPKRQTAATPKDTSKNASDDDARAEQGSEIEELKSQLRRAETSVEDREKELFVVQSRLDDAVTEQTKLEEIAHGNTQKIETLENEKRDTLRRIKDLETRNEAVQTAAMNDKEEAVAREEELNQVIQRLKESLLQKESRWGLENRSLSRTGSFRGRASNDDTGQAASQSPIQRDSSQSSTSKLVHEKDKIIEDLRLELAEAQIRLVEMENAGGGRVRELEKVLLETRMNNARLMEDNESYQVLLSEKTLNGDLAKGGIFGAQPTQERTTEAHSAGANNRSSLADELENANSDTETEPDLVRRLEAEVTAAKEQNKALTLYINKIISRLLQNEQFESLFSEGSSTGEPTLPNLPSKPTEKELPPRPSSNDGPDEAQENSAPTFLQRAGSLFGGRNKPRPRPSSILAPAPGDTLTTPQSLNPPLSATSDMSESAIADSGPGRAVHEDPNLAPSLPFKRASSTRGNANRGGHRRSRSDWSSSIAGTLNRNAFNTDPSGSPPSVSSSRQASYNALTGTPPPPLILEDKENETQGLEADQTDQNIAKSDVASDSGYAESVGGSMAPSDGADAPSPPRSSDGKLMPSHTVFTSGSGGKMRPLKLVQEQKEAEEAALAEKKKANRSSFMGWFQRGNLAAPSTLPLSSQSPSQAAPRASLQESRPTSGGGNENQ